MPHKFILDRDSSFKWPRKCAICFSENIFTTAKVTGTSPAESGVEALIGVVKYRYLTLSFPVCHRHRWNSILFMAAKVLAFCTIVLAFFTLVAGETPAILSVFGLILGGVALFLSFDRQPIRPGMTRDGATVISIRNHEFAGEFEQINGEALSAYRELQLRGLR
jgi:hypothetical protein